MDMETNKKDEHWLGDLVAISVEEASGAPRGGPGRMAWCRPNMEQMASRAAPWVLMACWASWLVVVADWAPLGALVMAPRVRSVTLTFIVAYSLLSYNL
ncbi:hypothetical protein V6N13_124085 [Hibiscus sabdariffa]